MMRFGLFDRALRSQRRAGASPEDYVVARAALAAPSAWVFYDGSDVVVTDRTGGRATVPGGAFFLDEAKPFESARQAQAQADRLNAAAPAEDGEGWVAVAVRTVIQSVSGFTPVIGTMRQRSGDQG